ncbi:MAG: citrate synthase family protein [Desulfuromonadaceae bacterium]|nr:citrate synthase family protein [Desulfuromonadaceae bacterium]MDD5105693.1 citrate synthase family protein [Desulfuromonadaceae bacterium]
MTRFYSAKEASERLGVSRNTLYAYVSRGLIRSEPVSPAAKSSRYHVLDVERMATRSELHKAPAKALQGSIDWGAPILESEITLIGDETFYYRGHSVPQLAAEATFEKVATLLWDSPLTVPNPQMCTWGETFIEHNKTDPPVDLFLRLLALLNKQDVAAFRFTPEATISAGTMMINCFLRIVTGTWPTQGIASHLATAWRVESAYATLLDSALILVADHELNISSFTARCAASAGCSPYAAVAAATHAFFGRRHGGNTERIRGLLDEANGRGSLYEVIGSRVKRGDPVPGFGHRLYNADPRSRFLLPRLPDRNGFISQALEASSTLLGGAYPTVDFALVVMEKELALPEQSGTHLFYLGRLAGLVAHIMEQYAQNQPIRPRARYVGVQP